MTRHAIAAAEVFGHPGCDTVVVDDGRIEAITHHSKVGVPLTEHSGKTILGPFIDSHLHPLGYAALVTGISLMECSDMQDLRDRLRDAATRLPEDRALMAQRLDDSRLGRLPDRTDLDTALGDRPAIVYRYCGHVAVVNTAALDLAGVGPDTPDPPGGSLDRGDDGRPTGVLRETAIDLVAPSLDPILPIPSADRVLEALESLAAVGIGHTGAMVAAHEPLWAGVGDELGMLCQLADDLPLTADVMVMADTLEEFERAARRIEGAGGKLRFWGWKGFADGSLGGHTAAMWQPYVDRDTTGTMRLTNMHGALARRALEMGGVVAVHAIGDRAIDATLDLFEQLVAGGADPSRLRIEHVSVPSPGAIRRIARSGFIASVQPAFLASEADWVPPRLGPERTAYPLLSMARAGIEMVGGSDCPVEPPDPLAGIAAAVHRAGWADAEHLDLGAAVALFTDAPARHFGRPAPLEPGSRADLIVVDHLGSEHASVDAVYRRGVRQLFRPIEWPG
jgi:predicted amidohydrolase YtcJ